MTRRTRAVGWLLTVGALWPSAHVSAQAPWSELRGDGFVLRSQLPLATLTTVACDLRTAIRVLGPVSDSLAMATPRSGPRVVAVDSARDIRQWLPEFKDRGRGNPLGAYWRGLYGDHIVVRVDAPPAERVRRILHEYAHFATHDGSAEPARWLDEGISEVWEHAAISPRQIEIGRSVPEHLKRLRSQKDWIPIREVVAANAIPTRSTSSSAMFYAESWALVHYLMFNVNERTGQPALTLRPNPADIPTDAVLRDYVRGRLGKVVQISRPPDGGECQGPAIVRAVPALESLIDRAQALADGERPEAALPLLLEALAVAPDSTEALETVGFVHFRGNRPVEAASVFDQVIAANRASHISYYYRAVLAGPVPARTDGRGRISEVEYLQKALALNPGFPPAVQRLRELMGKY